MKKALSIIMSLVIAITTIACFSSQVFLAASGTAGSVSWNLDDDGVLTLSGTGSLPDYSLQTSAPWYSNKSKIKRIIVENGVTGIGKNNFASGSYVSGYTAIQSVELADSVVSLGDNCFKGATGLTGIELPAGCTRIGSSAFNGCTSLKWAILSNDNTNHNVADSMFYGCTSLEQVFIGTDYTGFGASSFYNCAKLSAIIWSGNNIQTVGNNALYRVPSSLHIIGNRYLNSWATSNNYAYQENYGTCGTNMQYTYDCSAKSIVLSGSGSIDSYDWSTYCYLIKGIDFSEVDANTDVTICDNAFKNCTQLSPELNLQANVTSIGSQAFNNAGCQFVTVLAPSVTIGTNAFSPSKKISFYGLHDSGVYDYVKAERQSTDLWKYCCLNGKHSFVYDEAGSGAAICEFCDIKDGYNTVTDKDEHNYAYQAKDGNNLYYTCLDCGSTTHTEKIADIISDFSYTVSTSATPYTQRNYDGRFDIVRDGYVNARDYAVLQNMSKDIKTGFEMTLTNKNATKEAKKVYSYICSVYKNQIITGQQESTWMGSEDYEFEYIQQKTGKQPAIRGFDFMNDDFDGCVRRAKAWAAQGGIVTICWHCSAAFDKSYDECKADTLSTTQWNNVLTPGTTENQEFIAGMDKAGRALQELQAEGIPVIWRPFHEFDGKWFWWGKGGNDTFKRLWIMMYNHFTNDLELNNLIWMLGYSHNGNDTQNSSTRGNMANWYPGDQYCDIVGADTYEVSKNGAESRLHIPLEAIVGNRKPLAMHENGRIPTIAQFQSVPWAYFMTWHTSYITDENTDSALSTMFNSDYAITLDELPDLYS